MGPHTNAYLLYRLILTIYTAYMVLFRLMCCVLAPCMIKTLTHMQNQSQLQANRLRAAWV